MSKPYTITTAISYPNGRPHIGHAYEVIATDAIARFQRMMGRDVFFQTGTDEHGLKMAQTARNRDMEPRALADEMSGYFKAMNDGLNISYDRFIRTSEPDHHCASQAIWQAMEANGDLYLGRYEGWYSVRDEAFYDEKELTEGEGGQKLSPQGTPVEWTVEESWFFRLSAYQQKLLDLYANQPDFIQPDSRRNEIMRFVEGGLSDLSVSRTSFDWGVKVPGSDGHVMYVWVDALTNYITGCGYPDDTERMARYWSEGGDITHIIGKDIVRFHTVYWPAFLMSAKLPLPKQVFGHGFLLNRGEKMSKSLGNVADPMELAERFGVDQLRYFLLSEVTFGNDGSYSAEAIVARSNSDLANSFGNLAQRTLSFIAKNLEGRLPEPNSQDVDAELLTLIEDTDRNMTIRMNDLAPSVAIELWMRAVFACNAYIDAQAPWTLRKTDPVRMEAVLATLYAAIGNLAILIQPIIPGSASALLDQMGVPQEARNIAGLNSPWYADLRASGFTLNAPKPLFPRLELPVEEA
ncbi:methionyl-tRNA synthetase [Sphingobium indicum IP26]|uniref:Methionine--tRNA ligase n=1 Tax=Sphingobium indicum F2 TaxID=1450518 RepID=A0A8E0WTM6_9SPHN|nr:MULTISPECIES: methionine--tRNA ligase [Sphingobium]EPR09835.1 methionyl-tRNA synthetase [Sphingobium indicum IP26]EQB04963.1 methionyl-tRNA synthetase [Sphingobium sp. HDIP04]KER37217.1 methionine--tRNA ligase [Sphingobium indicum F2]